MSKDFKRFFYKKTVVEEGDTIWLAWYLIDRERREGVHFHGIQYKDSYKPVTYEPWENMLEFIKESNATEEINAMDRGFLHSWYYQ